MNLTVPEQSIWIICQAMAETAGPQASTILTQAGLGRFVASPPQPTATRLVASQEEVIRLHQEVYRMLGERGIRLFYRNYGETLSAAFLQLPLIQQWIAEAARLPAAQQLGWFVKTYAAFGDSGWTRQTVHEDKTAWYMTQDVCYYCVGIQGAQRPLCVVGTVLTSRLARAVLGRPVQVEEITCAATGAEHCTFALYK